MPRNLSDPSLRRAKDARDLPLVEVSWVDASSTHGWFTAAEARQEANPVPCLTIGRLVRNDREVTAVAQTVSAEGKFGGLWSIPRQWVKKVRRLR